VADVTNYTIENASGANVRTDLNNVFAAIQSSNSKSTDLATSQCVAGMTFLNTTTDILKIRNSSNNGFTEIGNIDSPNLGLLPRSGGTMTGLDLRFREASGNGTNYVGFQAPSAVSSNVLWTLPATDTSVAGYALVSDGSGNLSWGVAGGASQGIFWENSQTVTSDYTITNGKNAGSFGPITIQSGVTVTVGSGETWTVV
jgi:hypothetical protein